jgi:hypothetical protein
MKTSIAGALALLLIAAAAAGQDSGRSTPNTVAVNNGSSAAQKALTVSGRVSDDGKVLLTDIDSEWSVSNAEALRGQEGRMVVVRCYVDSEKNRIRVLSVKRGDSSTPYAARYADSAFRR